MTFASLDDAYFERLYARHDDPWHFATSAYEREKYADTLAHLPAPQFANALEIGCSVGVLTAMLAPRCGRLLAVDINGRALATARARCATLPQVRFERMTVPAEFPAEAFDLIVLSEVGYYWSGADLARARDRLAGAARGGHVLLVHFLPKVEDYPRDGDSVHAAFAADPRFRPVRAARRERYRIDLFAA